jgi:WD40 repeat protein
MKSLSAILSVCAALAGYGADGPKPVPAARVWDFSPNGPIAFLPDGAELLTVGAENVLQLRKVPSGELERTIGDAGTVIRSVAISPNQRLMASAGSDAMVRLWDFPDGRESRTLKGQTAVIQSIAFSPDGSKLAGGSSDKTVRIWDVKSGRTELTFHQPGKRAGARPSAGIPGMVFAVAFSPDGTLLASGGGDGAGEYGELLLWDLKRKQMRQSLLGAGEQQVWALAFTPDGKRLVSGQVNGKVKMFDVASGAMAGELEAGESLRAIAISPDGSILATGTVQSIKLWDPAKQVLKRTLESPNDFMTGTLAFSPDGKWLASEGRRVRLWEIPDGK